MAQNRLVLLDTDIGSDIDDAACLAYLLAESRCRLLGVSTVSGQAPLRAGLAGALCRAAGREDVPVWSGTEAPLIVEQNQPEAPQAKVLGGWEHQEEFEPNRAVWEVRETIRSHPGEVTLLTVGPLTNAALLFALDPGVPTMLREMVIMGGRFFEAGGSEWNVRCDPHAAAVVFAAQVPRIRLYGLNVTTRCRKDARECRELFSGGAPDVVAQMAEVWFEGKERITFHDPLAACCLFEPRLCAYRAGRVGVNLGKPPGRTTFEPEEGGPHRVAEEVDAEAFFQRYVATVQKLKP